MKIISCTVANTSQAERVVGKLESAGIANADISVLFAEGPDVKHYAHEKASKAPEGAATGAGTGGIIGGVLGLLAGIGSLAIPGAGPFIAAGPIMAALSGAAVGATAGGLVGGLVGLGIPEYEAKMYESKLKEGRILLAVHTRDDQKDQRKRVKEIFREEDGKDISELKDELAA